MALSSVPDVVIDNLVSVVVGQTVRVPLNVSARPVNVAISTADGADTPSGIQVVNSELVITDTRRDFDGSYNISVSNSAGVTSTVFDVQVQSKLLMIVCLGNYKLFCC